VSDVGSDAARALAVELEVLKSGGVPRSVLLEGPAGTGKTTLGDAYCRDAERLGCQVAKATKRNFREVAKASNLWRAGRVLVMFVDEVEDLPQEDQMIMEDLVRESGRRRVAFLASCNYPGLLVRDLLERMHRLRVDVPPGIRERLGLRHGVDVDLRDELKRMSQPRSIHENAEASDRLASELSSRALGKASWSGDDVLAWAREASLAACPVKRFFELAALDPLFDPGLAPVMHWSQRMCAGGADPWLAFALLACTMRERCAERSRPRSTEGQRSEHAAVGPHPPLERGRPAGLGGRISPRDQRVQRGDER
jgi:hypothetical protein